MARLKKRKLHMDSVQAYASCICIASVCTCSCGHYDNKEAVYDTYFWKYATTDNIQA